MVLNCNRQNLVKWLEEKNLNLSSSLRANWLDSNQSQYSSLDHPRLIVWVFPQTGILAPYNSFDYFFIVTDHVAFLTVFSDKSIVAITFTQPNSCSFFILSRRTNLQRLIKFHSSIGSNLLSFITNSSLPLVAMLHTNIFC